MKKIVFIILPFVLHCQLSLAQSEHEEESFYMGVEMGSAIAYRNFVQMSVWLQSDRDYYRVRIAGAIDQPFELVKPEDQRPFNNLKSKAVYDFGFIYGMHISFSKKHALQLGTGISIIQTFDPDQYYNNLKQPNEPLRFKERSAVGLPMEVKYGFKFYQDFQLTGAVASNINRLKSYAGISLGFAVKFF